MIARSRIEAEINTTLYSEEYFLSRHRKAKRSEDKAVSKIVIGQTDTCEEVCIVRMQGASIYGRQEGRAKQKQDSSCRHRFSYI